MSRYRIEISPKAEKQLTNLTKDVSSALRTAILALGENPRPPAAKHLVGMPLYRLRWRDYRIVYAIYDDRLVVSAIKAAHRREVYS